MRGPVEIADELRARSCHIRQYLGDCRFEIWIDGRMCVASTDPFDAESRVRELIHITPEEGAMLDRYLERLARGESPEMN